jgi:hypothetical protein
MERFERKEEELFVAGNEDGLKEKIKSFKIFFNVQR